MKILLTRLALLTLLALSGCATIGEPAENKDGCRVVFLNGQGRYGTFTQYVEGDVIMIRITTKGGKCPGATIDIKDKELGITVKYTSQGTDDYQVPEPKDDKQ